MLNSMLVSMPYTILSMPSISIAQLTAVVKKTMKGDAKVDSAHCFIDFAEFIGLDNYNLLGSYDGKSLSDWLFRKVAFADVEDNFDSYQKFFFADGKFPRKQRIFDLVVEKRQQIDVFFDNIIEKYNMCEYDIVGFTSMMSQNIASFALASKLKELNPDILTIMGGPNCEHPMGKTIANNVPQIDYVFSGEALISFPAFLKAIKNADYNAVNAIRGVQTSDRIVGKKAVGAERMASFDFIPVIQETVGKQTCGEGIEVYSGENYNLNDLPLLDYSQYLDSIRNSTLKDELTGELILPFQTSTGCWWADKVTCSFCGLTPHKFRQMTPAKAKDYINATIDKYADDFSIFEAVDPCMPVEYAQEVFPHINRDKKTVLQYEVKSKMAVEDMKAMAEANVLLPQPGIESISTKTLKLMRKGVTGFHNIQFLKNCIEQGLYPIWNYLYGLPNNEYDELETGKLMDDIQTLQHLPPPTSNVLISFQRYSEYFNDADKYNLKLKPADSLIYVYPYALEIVENLAYTFHDAAYFENFLKKYQGNIEAINLEIVSWMYKFREDVPKLYFKDEFIIFDSRFDKLKQYKIQKLEKDILIFLNTQKSISEIADQFSLDINEAEKIISEFMSARFLFTDKGKYLNVVCERCLITKESYKEYFVDFVAKSSTAYE